MDYAYSVFLLLGGIGMFLYGINFMSQSLELAAGDNLRTVLEKLTTKPLKALLVGAGTTAVIQSSGATMVMTANFVSAQLMNLSQALYVMLGAAVGTTITAQIIAFNISPWAPLILFVGMIMYLFVKSRFMKKLGGIVLGFGILFVGITIMGDAIEQMNLAVVVKAFLSHFSNPVLAILFGFIFTFIIQSSSASIGILQVIVASAGSTLELKDLVYIILGMNIGSLAPLIIFALKGNKDSKRATLMQSLTRVLAVCTFGVLIAIVPGIVNAVVNLTPLDYSRQVANFHLLYNLFAAVIIFPLIPLFRKLGYKLMPEDPNAELSARKLLYLTKEVLDSMNPVLVMAMAKKEIIRFATLCNDNLKLAIKSFFEGDESACEKVSEMEETINVLNHDLNVALIKAYSSKFSTAETNVGSMFNIVADFERIGDHAENISEYTLAILDSRAKISPEGFADLKRIADKVLEMIDVTMKAYETEDKIYLGQAQMIEDQVDDLQEELVDHHITRMGDEICDPRGGVIYTDLVSDLERISDHAMNVAESILGVDTPIEHQKD